MKIRGSVSDESSTYVVDLDVSLTDAEWVRIATLVGGPELSTPEFSVQRARRVVRAFREDAVADGRVPA